MVKKHVKVVDKGWTEIIKNVNQLQESQVKTGFPTGGKVGGASRRGIGLNDKNQSAAGFSKPNGSDHPPYQNIPDVASVASDNEFGVPEDNVPPRPFMRTSFDEAVPKLTKLGQKVYVKATEGAIPPEQATGIIGEFLVAEIRRKIRNLKHPPNADMTIMLKGSDNPLIDTGQMIQSVQHVTIKKPTRKLTPAKV